MERSTFLNQKREISEKELYPSLSIPVNDLKLQEKDNLSKEKFSLSELEKILQVGEGTYGKVFKVKKITSLDYSTLKPELDKLGITNQPKYYALKKLIYEAEEGNGFPVTALREISILQELEHKNVVKLYDIITSKAKSINKKENVYLVLEYLEHDLSGILNKKIKFNEDQIKCIMYQLLEGLDYMHRIKGVLHRDIKPSNILINNEVIIKIADFGLARHFSNKDFKARKTYTSKVITLWYRPPELFLGENFYKEGVDIWSVGILFWQLFLGYAPIRAENDSDQLDKIISVLGSIDEEDWPEAKYLKKYKMLIDDKVTTKSRFHELTKE